MPAQMHPKFKRPVPLSETLVQNGTPYLYFQVQAAFQQRGVDLVDLDTGDVYKGQVNIDDIGLIASEKAKKIKRRFGFITPHTGQITEYEKRDIDAVLYLDQELQRDNEPLLLLIRVIEKAKLTYWSTVALEIANQFARRIPGRSQRGEQFIPDVIFGLTALSAGDDPVARLTALRKVQRYDLDSPGVSGIFPIIRNSDFLDDEDNFEDC